MNLQITRTTHCGNSLGAVTTVRAVQLFGCLAVVETHTLWYFGHHCCLVLSSDVLGIWHFWIFTLLHPSLPFCTHFLLIFTTSTLFLRRFLPTMGTLRRPG